MRRKLTKKHLFDYEMKYKHILSRPYNYEKLTLRNFDQIVYNVYYSFSSSDYKTIFKFIDDYIDLIDFEKFVINNYVFINGHYRLFISKYNKQFNQKVWSKLTHRLTYKGNEDLIRRYKEHLDFSILQNYHIFSPELLLELKDKVDVKKVLSKMGAINYETYNREVNKRINNYIVDHLEEVLTYKKDDNNKWKED